MPGSCWPLPGSGNPPAFQLLVPSLADNPFHQPGSALVSGRVPSGRGVMREQAEPQAGVAGHRACSTRCVCVGWQPVIRVFSKCCLPSGGVDSVTCGPSPDHESGMWVFMSSQACLGNLGSGMFLCNIVERSKVKLLPSELPYSTCFNFEAALLAGVHF